MSKTKKQQPERVVETDSHKGAEEKAEKPVGEYTIQMALAEAMEKFRDSIRPMHPRTIYREAQIILRNKRAATESPRRFEGENEYQAWLKSKGLVESHDDDYISQTGRNKFSSMD